MIARVDKVLALARQGESCWMGGDWLAEVASPPLPLL